MAIPMVTRMLERVGCAVRKSETTDCALLRCSAAAEAGDGSSLPVRPSVGHGEYDVELGPCGPGVAQWLGVSCVKLLNDILGVQQC